MTEKAMEKREGNIAKICYLVGAVVGFGIGWYSYKAGHKAGLSDMYAAITLASPEVAGHCSELAKNCVKS